MSSASDHTAPGSAPLDAFGESLIKQVRDVVIANWDQIVAGNVKSARAQRVHRALAAFSDDQLDAVRYIIPQIVDDALHYLLWFFEQERRFAISFSEGDEAVPDIRRDTLGELQGYLYDWIPRYSAQRYVPSG